MKKKYRLQLILFAFRWMYWLKTLVLLILFVTPSLLIFLFPGLVCADAMFSVDGGMGNFEIKTKDDQFQSGSKNSRRHIGFGIDLEEEEYPLRISFRWSFFDTGEESEKWTIGPLHENRLEIHGETFDVKGTLTLYNFASGKDMIGLKPFIGFGLGYKRFKFDRKGLNENIFILPVFGQYFLGNQDVTAIGATPFIGFVMELPRFNVECNVNIGWSFLSVRSNTNYHFFSGTSEVVHRLAIFTSGTSLVTGIQIVKSWESFSVSLGYIWEKTRIDDKLVAQEYLFTYPDESTYTTYLYFPFPEIEIIQTIGQIRLTYLF